MASETGPGVDPQLVAFVQRKLALENQVKVGTNWFFWIAGLSLFNSLAYRANLSWSFVVGLGMTQFVDGFAAGLTEALQSGGSIIPWISFGVNVLIAGMFVLFGVLEESAIAWRQSAAWPCTPWTPLSFWSCRRTCPSPFTDWPYTACGAASEPPTI